MEKTDYIFGTRAVIEAVKSGRSIEKILIRQGLDNELFSELNQMIQDHRIPFQFVPNERINRVTRKNHQGVLAYLPAVDFARLETVIPGLYETGRDPFILVLDQITDVRNFGAIVRTAGCGGVDAIIIPEKGIARISADVVKTSAGAIHTLPVCRVKSLTQAIRYLKDSGIRVIAATEKASSVYTDISMAGPLALVLGAEDRGISASILQQVDEKVRIPLFGTIESLNVSVAAGVMIYEAVRQRS
jgi:23S rRNA (guanosine2251-2'-O)-methyltransferase